MRAYICKFKNEDWICVVVAATAAMAKAIFWREQPSGWQEPEAWVDVRATWLRVNRVLSELESHLYDTCNQEAWMCEAWDYEEMCQSCLLKAWKERGCEGTAP